jgi:PAS domain S-box-containing protein
LLRYWLDPILEGGGFSISLVAVLIAAWIGGLGPCLLAQAFSILINILVFPPATPQGPTARGFAGLIAFFVVGIVVAVLSDAKRAAQLRAGEQAEDANSQREKLRATLSCMGDALITTDERGRITLMNRVAETLTGWTMAQAEGRPLEQVFRITYEQTGQPAECPVERVLREGPAAYRDIPLVLAAQDGRQLPIDLSAAPIQDAHGEWVGVVLVYRDQSQRQRTEQALREADRRKDEFLATLAHELRNPLAPIRNGLELLKMSADDPQLCEEVRDMMDRQTQQMVRLIDDLLDVSRITRGKLQLRKCRVELAEVMRGAVDATRPFIEEASHELAVSLPPEPIYLEADPHRLTQVLSNLLHNAAKYTPAGGTISLSLERQNGQAAIHVKDSGLGIPAEMLHRVFDMFTQVDRPLESNNTGLGIGLTLVRSLVEMHGGSVEARSGGANQGSEFLVRLPISQPPAAAPAAPPEISPAGKVKRRVLVVDDNPDALEALSMMVRILGNDVRKARDGLEAIEVAEAFRPDAVLMDLGMPKLNGYDAARRIREHAWGQDMVLIATTGWGQEEDKLRSRLAGFDHHLIKPVDPGAVQRLLTELPRTVEVSRQNAIAAEAGV